MNAILPTQWEKYSTALSAYVLKQVKDSAVADDIMQEVFLKVYEKSDTLSNEEKFKPWLFQVAKHMVIDYFRTQQKQHCLTVIEGLIDDNSGEGQCKTHKLASCISDMIAFLPQKYQEALRLSELEGLSQKELAKRLNLSYSGAKSRVQRGRLALKKLYEECCDIELDCYGNVLDYRPSKVCLESCKEELNSKNVKS